MYPPLQTLCPYSPSERRVSGWVLLTGLLASLRGLLVKCILRYLSIFDGYNFTETGKIWGSQKALKHKSFCLIMAVKKHVPLLHCGTCG